MNQSISENWEMKPNKIIREAPMPTIEVDTLTKYHKEDIRVGSLTTTVC